MHTPTVLSLNRYQFAAQCVRDLKAVLPAPVVYDVGTGQAQMQAPVETAGRLTVDCRCETAATCLSF